MYTTNSKKQHGDCIHWELQTTAGDKIIGILPREGLERYSDDECLTAIKNKFYRERRKGNLDGHVVHVSIGDLFDTKVTITRNFGQSNSSRWR